MKEKGFTLIELLAVIVILAIIAMIAIPIILNIIDDSKNSSNKRSIELYGKAIENAVGRYQLKNPQDKDITLEKIQEYIEYKGNEVECETTEINEDGTIYLSECSVGGERVDYTYGKQEESDTRIYIPATDTNKTLAGTVPQGNFDMGDEYIINVDGTHKYHFYVLNTDENNVNLILSGNICSDGTLATSENKCTVDWISDVDYIASGGEINKNDHAGCEYADRCATINVGPVTAMNYLYEATKNWSNIPNMEIMGIYDEIGNSIKLIDSNVTALISKDDVTVATYENLKAKLPNFQDIGMTGCNNREGNCPAWMVNRLNGYTSKYPIGTKEDLSGISGYWTFSVNSAEGGASIVNSYGCLNNIFTVYTSDYGIRPVITIPKSQFN